MIRVKRKYDLTMTKTMAMTMPKIKVRELWLKKWFMLIAKKLQTFINRAGRLTIAPGGKSTISVDYWVAIRIRLCHAPRLRIIRWLISSGATIPSDALEDKRETAFNSRCSGTGGGV